MPAILATILPWLLRMAGGFGAERLAGAAAPAIGKAVPMLGKALGSGIGRMGAFAGGDALAGMATDALMPQTNSESFSALMNQTGGMGSSAFDKAVKERQLHGTLMQALAQSGVDPRTLQGVL